MLLKKRLCEIEVKNFFLLDVHYLLNENSFFFHFYYFIKKSTSNEHNIASTQHNRIENFYKKNNCNRNGIEIQVLRNRKGKTTKIK